MQPEDLLEEPQFWAASVDSSLQMYSETHLLLWHLVHLQTVEAAEALELEWSQEQVYQRMQILSCKEGTERQQPLAVLSLKSKTLHHAEAQLSTRHKTCVGNVEVSCQLKGLGRQDRRSTRCPLPARGCSD